MLTCVNFGDILAWTLPQNKALLDDLVVVTVPEDAHTRKVCEHYHVRTVLTNAFKEEGGAKNFNKAAGVNAGLETLSRHDWVLHLDADILLPPRAHEMIERAEPDPTCIYGVDRVNCPTFEEYIRYATAPEPQLFREAFLAMNRWPMGARLIREEGYVPIGFFQLWNPSGSGVQLYNTLHDEYNHHCDVTHAEQWPRSKRQLIPELIAIHLMSENEGHGTNWNGRVSKPFGAA